jgi:hypothetical protein
MDIGFLRSLQGDIMAILASFVVLLCVYAVIAALVKRSVAESDVVGVIRNARRVIGLIAALILLGFVSRAAEMAATNRMPREDADKSGVYDQMDDNLRNNGGN